MIKHSIKDSDSFENRIEWRIKVNDDGNLNLYGNDSLILAITKAGEVELFELTKSDICMGLKAGDDGNLRRMI